MSISKRNILDSHPLCSHLILLHPHNDNVSHLNGYWMFSKKKNEMFTMSFLLTIPICLYYFIEDSSKLQMNEL